jgi:DNA polymerase
MSGSITIDFETRSAFDLVHGGAFKYAEHPTTEPLCLAVKPRGEAPLLWVPERFRGPEYLMAMRMDGLAPMGDEELAALVEDAETIEAHNAMFDWLIWREKMVPAGFPEIPVRKLRDTAAMAVAAGLPRPLEQACLALGTQEDKDLDGARLMRRLCKPRRPRKLELRRNPELAEALLWNEEPGDLARLCLYCCQDVTAQEDLSRMLPDLPPQELEVWRLDFAINCRGVRADLKSAEAVTAAMAAKSATLREEFRDITGLDSPTQRDATLELLRDMGVPLAGLARGDVSEALSSDDEELMGSAPSEARRILEIRQSLSKSSTAKYAAIREAACADGRLRGLFMYYGAQTGRWAGRLVQPQNFPRGAFPDTEQCLALFRAGDAEAVEMLYGDLFMAASTCLRGVLEAADGCDFVCADYSAIEGRVLAWLAGEETALDVYRRGEDPYKVAAAAIYGKAVAEVTKAERQVGKTAELACGYQGALGAFQAMARNFGLDLEDSRAQLAVNGWRESRPKTVNWWHSLERAAMKALDCRGEAFRAGKVSFLCADNCLIVKLPSGRCLRYRNPAVATKEVPWGLKDCLCYQGVSQTTRQWSTVYLYGGKLAENITQATARDVLCRGMLACERAGYRIVMHVHDEAVAEVPEGFGSVGEYEGLLCETAPWAEGLPLKAEGWRGKRYRK